MAFRPPRNKVNGPGMWGRYLQRRGMYGGGGGSDTLGSGIESLGSDLGKGIANMITRGKQNSAADAQMQQYNDINPPRADLVSVPGESVAQWSQQNPNVPTQQSTIPAPYGQGAQGLQTWMQMQQQSRAADTAQQQAAMRGMAMARGGQSMNLAQQRFELAKQKYQDLQSQGPKLPAGANADINKIAVANALAKQYTGLTIEDVTKNPQDWHKSQDGTFYTNDVLSKYYNRQIAVPPDVWEKNAPSIMAGGAILQRYRNTPLAPEIDKQLGLSRAGQPNISEPQGEQPQPGQTDYTKYYQPGPGYDQNGHPTGQAPRAQPTAGGQIPQTPTNQQVLPPSSNMQSDYFKQNPPQNPSGATPAMPNPAATGGAPPVAGSAGKLQSTADKYIYQAIGASPSDVEGDDGQ